MFRVYQVRCSSYNKRYRGQLICGGISRHQHLFTITRCSPYNNIQPTSSGMPPFLSPSSYQSYINTTQQLDSVAIRKIISQNATEVNSIDQMNDNSNSNTTIIEDENCSSMILQETSTTSRTVTTNITSEIQSSNEHLNDTIEESLTRSLDKNNNSDLTWITWDWPGTHTPCPFNPRNINGQLSIQTHHLPVRYMSY
jgi:hypothetical protein